jgi:hypothetical protein
MIADPTDPGRDVYATVAGLRTFMRLATVQRRAVILVDVLGYTPAELGEIAGSEAEATKTYTASGAQGFVFRSTDAIEGHHDVLRMGGEMRPRAGGEVLAAGLAVLVLDRDGRIRADHQFPWTGSPHSRSGRRSSELDLHPVTLDSHQRL